MYRERKKMLFAMLSLMLLMSTVLGTFAVVEVGMTLEEKKYISIRGRIEEIVQNEGVTAILVGEGVNAVYFYLNPEVFILDSVSLMRQKIDDLAVGQEVEVFLYKHSPMTLSIPAQTSGAELVLINADQVKLQHMAIDQNSVVVETGKELVLSEDSTVMPLKGEVVDIKKKEVLAIYSAEEEITPNTVVILGTMEELIHEADEMVPLRELAVNKGYAVEWDNTKKMAVLTLADIRVELTIGETAFTYSHKTKDIQPLDMMSELTEAPQIVNGRTMVPISFIEALIEK